MLIEADNAGAGDTEKQESAFVLAAAGAAVLLQQRAAGRVAARPPFG